jgi:Holliday junction resolvasome RuvABC endonuclease subunit
MIVAGIDYSLTSPAICVHSGDTWSVDNCRFYYLVHREKMIVTRDRFQGSLYMEWETDVQRHNNLATWSSNIITDNQVSKCFIEGYAYGASGRALFQIAENTGHLKQTIWSLGIPFEIFAPTEVKKFATTKGNANKQRMYECFVEETLVDIRSILDIMNCNQWNPVSDIVDSYYIAKLGFMRRREQSDHQA